MNQTKLVFFLPDYPLLFINMLHQSKVWTHLLMLLFVLIILTFCRQMVKTSNMKLCSKEKHLKSLNILVMKGRYFEKMC